MKAVGLLKYLPIEHNDSLMDIEVAMPELNDYDLLVEVKAVSVNPVDTKVRAPKETVEASSKILGWDASGVVKKIGKQVKNFKAGDEVFYAGDINRQGSNAEFQAVDSRIVGKKPKTLTYSEAAALPLTAITAWEVLFDRMKIDRAKDCTGKSLLIIGAAGGVGSIAIQIARLIKGLHITASASSKESIEHVRNLGAHTTIDHFDILNGKLVPENQFDYIFCAHDTDAYFEKMTIMIKPQGMITSIVETHKNQNLQPLMAKAATFSWELMFTRSMFQTDDMFKQGELLNEVGDYVDRGIIKTTKSIEMSGLSAQNLKEAHRLLESKRTIGKIVITV